MNGINKDDLRTAMATLSAHHCCYEPYGIHGRCDCKFGVSSTVRRGEKGNGCPELNQVAALLHYMTEEEFQNLCGRAGIYTDAKKEEV